MEIKLHPTVSLAEGITVPEDAWIKHRPILTEGIPNHRVHIIAFPTNAFGDAGIVCRISPLDKPEPLSFKES